MRRPVWKSARFLTERFLEILQALQAYRHPVQAPIAMPAGAENANAVLLVPVFRRRRILYAAVLRCTHPFVQRSGGGKRMKIASATVMAVCALVVCAPARGDDSAIAQCGPNDGYVTLYQSLDTFDIAGRVQCGARLELLESQKTYAAQHTSYVRVATDDGKQGYLSRAAITIVRNAPPANRGGATARALTSSSAVPAAPTAAPSEIRLLDGTEIEVKLSADLSSDRISEGSIVNLEVSDPVSLEGVTLFERGALAHARITQIKKAGRWGQNGEMSWTMLDVTAVDGTRIPARFVTESQTSADTTGVIAASGNLLAGVQPSFSLRKGEPAFVPAGQIFRVFLHGDTVVHLESTKSIARQ